MHFPNTIEPSREPPATCCTLFADHTNTLHNPPIAFTANYTLSRQIKLITKSKQRFTGGKRRIHKPNEIN